MPLALELPFQRNFSVLQRNFSVLFYHPFPSLKLPALHLTLLAMVAIDL
jgi:hypothetical protein